jgi:hypothetical protein
MSINLKSLMSKYNSSSPREKMMVLALAGTIAVGGTYWLTVLYDTSNTKGNPPSSTTVAKPQPAKPTQQLALAQETGTRNPFLPPSEFQLDSSAMPPIQKVNQPGSTPPFKPIKDYTDLDRRLLEGTGKKQDSKVQNGRPGLVGIVEGADKRIAIIQYGGNSRSYGIYERIGPYQITSISSSSVILSGPAGRTVLAVGR